jgi:protoporphyrinogen/coproporphyrinogen III oxidase
MRRIAIVGGGIAGLTAAYTLEQYNKQAARPLDYVLIERSNHLGGKVVTENIDGFVVEAGPDCFVAEKPWIPRLASELMIEQRLLVPNESSKRSFILSGGKVHELPEGLLLLVPTKITPFLLSHLISWKGKMRMACDFVIPKKKDPSDETLSHFVQRRLGKELLDKIATPLVAGIHSNDPETMSLQASFPRFLKMEEEYGSLLRAMLAAKRKASSAGPKGKGAYFLSFRDGMGEISDSLVAHIDKHRVLSNKSVSRIQKSVQEKKTEYRLSFDDGQQPIDVDAVVITTVANQAARLLEDVDDSIVRLLRDIPLTSSANLSLAFKSNELGRIPGGFGLMIPAIEKRKISAFTLSSTKWNNRVPDPRYSLLRVFVGGYRNQELVLMDDKDLLKVVRDELYDLFGISAAPTMTRIHRWIEDRPQYSMGHIDRVKGIEDRLSDHGGLFLAGCSYHGIGVGDCVASGMSGATAAIAFLDSLQQPEQ